ncbi:MAG TPA: hypothetical protein VFA77_02690, partial [Candidatus Eisenbacteria bacterium]|nr:hypothetical protein [Candidatus Eisenbacteria bacterium]
MLLRICAGIALLFVASLSSQSAVLIPQNSSWKYLKGLSEASAPDNAAWRSVDFDDSTWPAASTPFWYGDAQPTTGTQLTDMRGRYTCIFLRKSFQLTDPAQTSALQLGAVSDDGFIAWINGAEVARYNMPEDAVPFNGISLPALAEPLPFETFLISAPASFLVGGTNILAIQAFNENLTNSTDFVINASLTGIVDETPPAVTALIPPDGAAVRTLPEIEIHFSEPV